jgi:RimJ/RimL family protein N-acetyltransferase
MGRFIIANQDERVAKWVSSRMAIFEFGATPYTAIGLANETGSLLAGVVYQNYTKTNIDMHVAALPGKRWLCKAFLGECFRYPFEQLQCARVTGLVPGKNIAAAEFDQHIGFIWEGRVRRILADGDDLIIYGMLREECRFLNVGRNHGHKQHSTNDGWRRETPKILSSGRHS